MINELLSQLGFGEKETAVYLALLQHGKITPASLAHIVKINRTTVYSIAKELVQKGVIAEDLGNKTLYLVAKPPQDLEILAQKEEKQLDEKRNIIKNAVEELQAITKATQYSIPKIVFKAEDEIENHLYSQTPAWDASVLKYDGLWWGFQDQTFVEHYEKWIDWYWEGGGSNQTSLRLISNEIAEKIKKKKFEKREIKFWEQSHNFTATTWILGDYVVMIVTSQRPRYLVEIYDAALAHNMREVFKGIWNTMESRLKVKG
jgi:sugar-specific transcriptional regulator TrmB